VGLGLISAAKAQIRQRTTQGRLRHPVPLLITFFGLQRIKSSVGPEGKRFSLFLSLRLGKNIDVSKYE